MQTIQLFHLIDKATLLLWSQPYYCISTVILNPSWQQLQIFPIDVVL